MAKKPTGKQAAIDVLRERGEPMLVKDLLAEAVKRTGLKGKTPGATIAAQIYTGAKKKETFRLVKRGVVELLPESAEAAKDDEGPAVTPNSEVVRDSGLEARPDPKQGKAGRQKAGGRSTE